MSVEEATPRRGLWRRASWNLVDQVLSSATNAALSFLVARAVSETAFGGFAVAFTIFALLAGLGRALTTSPLGIRFSDAGPEEFAVATARATGAALVLGVVAAVGCVVVGLLLGGSVGPGLVALGVVLPGLLLQDAWRYVFFAAGRPAAAALNDAVWAVVQIGAVVALLVVGTSTAPPLILAWGVSAAAAAALGLVQARRVPRPAAAWRWTRAHRDLTRYLVAEYATLQGCQQGALLVIAAIASLEVVGVLRAVQVLLGPTTILAVATLAFAVPEFSRRRATMAPRQWMRAAVTVGGGVATLGLVWGLLFTLAPDVLGRTLLGATWPGTEAILVPTIVGQFGGAFGIGPAAMLYAMDRARATFAVHVVEAPLIVIGGVVGVLLGGATGAAWGLGVPFWVATPLLFRRLYREAHGQAGRPAQSPSR